MATAAPTVIHNVNPCTHEEYDIPNYFETQSLQVVNNSCIYT